MLATPTPLADWVIVLPVVLCLLGGAVLLMLRRFVRLQAWVAMVVVAAVLACDAVLFARILELGPLSMTMGNWLPPFGISFTADVMGAGFALAAAFATLCVIFYLGGDAPETARRDGLFPLVLLLLAGVSGAFLTGDLFNLYVWFEVMLIASFGLIVLAGHPLQLDGAVKYGVLNVVATALFLMAVGLLYGQLGTLNMADIIGAAARADRALLTTIAALFGLAFAMKAAVFPVNAWLPAAYHTPPAAISALLGGLLTKVGAYALLRVLVMLLPTTREGLAPAVATLAIATMILGPLCAVAETNLRRAIGFLLIGGVGVIIAALPGARMGSLAGATVYVVHAVFTLAAFYLVAGLIERRTGQTDTRNMGGLYATSSLLSILFLMLMLALSGVPPFLGFWPKLLLLQGLTGAGDMTSWLLVFALLLNALLTLIATARLWSRIFWRSPPDGAAAPLPAPAAAATAAAALLTCSVFILGLWPGILIGAGQQAAAGLLDPARYIASVGLAP